MKSHLARRGGIWWARLVVPERHRAAVGRREFIQSCKTHELQIAKLVAAVLVATWRRQLLALEFVAMSSDILKIVEGVPVLTAGDFLPLGEAAELSGLSMEGLLRAAAVGRLELHCRLSWEKGVVMPIGELGLEPVIRTSAEKLVHQERRPTIPARHEMPDVYEDSQNGVKRAFLYREVAEEILVNGLESIAIQLFYKDDFDVFVSDAPVTFAVRRLEVSVAKFNALRLEVVGDIPLERVEQARAARQTAAEGRVGAAGKWAQKLFSEAVQEYCTRSDGLPATLAGEHEQRQRMNGLMGFKEFMGDRRLSEIDGDLLRAFRDGPLKEFPDHANRLKKEDRRGTMRETIEALKSRPGGYKRMTTAQRQERMLWLFRLFQWLTHKGYLKPDPAISLRGEDGLTKAEKVEASRNDDDEEEGRRQFTDAELKLIFGVRHYQIGSGAHVTKGNETWYPFQYWLPLLGLYTGCRIKEASQLHLSDVVQVESVWCLDINRRTADKSLKTDASSRRVPLNQKLIDLGFIEYCERLRQEGFRRVFPELSYALTPARYAKEPIRKISAMLKSLGMPRDGSLVYHCLRHNLNNALARVAASALIGADEKLRVFIRYRVIGHELPEDVNGKHYTATTAAEMAALVNGVQFDLPMIARFDIEHGLERVWGALSKKKAGRRGREDMGPLNPN